jgi:hypothetical protein
MALIALPPLLATALAVNGWRNIEELSRRGEWQVQPVAADQVFAGAGWRLEQARLIGDGRDTKQIFPGQMRLVIIRLSAEAKRDIGEDWGQCQLRLTDGKGHDWTPLDVILSSDLSRDLDPRAEPLPGCSIASLHPPAKGESMLIEEKFVLPADAVPHLAVRLSFASTRPHAISIPLALK